MDQAWPDLWLGGVVFQVVGVDLLAGQRGLDARGEELAQVLLAVSQAVNDATRLLLFLWGSGQSQPHTRHNTL